MALDGGPARLDPSPASKVAVSQGLRDSCRPSPPEAGFLQPVATAAVHQVSTTSAQRGSSPQQPSTPSAESPGPTKAPSLAAPAPATLDAHTAPARIAASSGLVYLKFHLKQRMSKVAPPFFELRCGYILLCAKWRSTATCCASASAPGLTRADFPTVSSLHRS